MPFFPDVSIFSRSKNEWIQLLYDDREMCSKPGPLGYSVSLTTAHLIAAPIYAVAFYTLYAEKSSNFKVYKRYLATHAVRLIVDSNLCSTWVKRAERIAVFARWTLIVFTISTVITLALCVVGLFDQTMHKMKLIQVGNRYLG
ncbi:hypothetical protein GCK72_017830 [Caenorhabditis remanei]|uniref:Uncharacterized protein n=1 Tax=Caenorhabditis remanei TaxID=31234 RepID=A0A6A5G8U6_CAERE|nr:hypothetical protein GCK72_017830 [Caenorhabditis remanei]KAF1751276.1 hypothetical protein GCK72_017830 [Caenorhabditis remanei]